jgi:hypothetical protein
LIRLLADYFDDIDKEAFVWSLFRIRVVLEHGFTQQE